MKLTPEKYRAIEKKWQKKVSLDSTRKLYSAAALQQKIARKFDTRFFKYVPCPICGEDRYATLHNRTSHLKSRWKDFLLNILIKTAGRKVTAGFIFFIFKKRIDFSRRAYRVVQCVRCGFFYRNPTYSEKNMQFAYNSNNYFAFLSGRYSRKRLRLYKYILDRADFNERTTAFSRRKLLDIGCGYGLFLSHMKTLGWDCYGLDFAADCIEFGKKTFGLTNIEVGNLEKNTFENNFFDAVSLISVAAHLNHPIRMFKKIHRVLRPDGLLLIWTVNADSLMHRHLMGHWSGFTLNHLVFFNSNSLAKALQKAGFSRVDIAYDSRLFDSLKKKQMISKENFEYFDTLMREKNLAEMLLAIAYKQT